MVARVVGSTQSRSQLFTVQDVTDASGRVFLGFL